MPKVGVVTPCHDGADYVGATVTSVRDQSFTDWAYVIVDDGSQDDSLRVVTEAIASDARIRVVSQTNQGVHAARNRGHDELGGSCDYLVFLDADDVLLPGFLAELVDHLDRHPSVGLVYCGSHVIDGSGRRVDGSTAFVPRFVPGRVRPRTIPVEEPETPLVALMSYHNAIPSTCLLRGAAYAETRGWRSFGVIEDKDMVLQMALVAPVHFLARHLVLYRRHDENRSLAAFDESMRALHRAWWGDEDLTPSQLAAVRRALVFDRQVAAHLSLARGRDAWRERRLGAAARLVAGAVKAYGMAALGASGVAAPVRP